LSQFPLKWGPNIQETGANLLIVSPEILFIDVRDPVEILLGGHPELIDAVVPVRLQSNVFNEDLLEWELKDNPDFLKYMDAALTEFGKTKGDMIVLTCGSGWRSAFAAGKLYDAGYTDVWHITDGYDGEEKPGLNSANAWHLQGFPWSYDAVLGSDNLQIAQ